MSKGSGGTRAGSSGNPRGLTGAAAAAAPSVRQLYDNEGWVTRGRTDFGVKPLGISVNDSTAEKDRDILDGVMGQLSDGIWENSRAMEKYWRTMEFAQDDAGNVVLRTVPDYTERRYRYSRGESYSYPVYNGSGIHGRTTAEAKNWIADKIRAVARTEMKDEPAIGKWSADNRTVLEYLTRNANRPITVADAYSLYRRLKG